VVKPLVFGRRHGLFLLTSPRFAHFQALFRDSAISINVDGGWLGPVGWASLVDERVRGINAVRIQAGYFDTRGRVGVDERLDSRPH